MSNRDELAVDVAAALDEIPGFIAWTDKAPIDLADAILASGYSKPRTITQWGSAHVANGAFYKGHESREAAQAFVDSMAEVGHQMIVVRREHVPATYSEWEPAP